MKNFEHAIMLLDAAAPSFCYYPLEKTDKAAMTELVLRKAISFCSREGYHVTAIYGNEPPDEACMKLLSEFPHMRIIPLKPERQFNSSDIYTVNFNDFQAVMPLLKPNQDLNMMIRLNMDDVLPFADLLERYWNRAKRLNLIFCDLASADETALNKFRLDLAWLNNLLTDMYTDGKHVELSCATDRMLLNEMKNCDAGVTHFTISPCGTFFVCPGFFHAYGQQNIGSLDTGFDFKNRHLFSLEYAVICNSCDCFHCKRCVYLNKKTTGEVNTPSHQQCVTSHHERNLSGMLLSRLKKRGFLNDAPDIYPLFYTDPFEGMENGELRIENGEYINKLDDE